MDFCRHLSYFPSVAFGGEATDEDRALMTDMVRRVREVCEREGRKRGRPILIAARCINSLELSLRCGLDVKTWLAEDLIDILMPLHGGEPWGRHQGSLKAFIELAHRYDVPAYPCLRRVDREDVGAHGATWEVCRGEAMMRFAEGADGITTFNRFVPTHRRWRSGESGWALMKPKNYTSNGPLQWSALTPKLVLNGASNKCGCVVKPKSNVWPCGQPSATTC